VVELSPPSEGRRGGLPRKRDSAGVEDATGRAGLDETPAELPSWIAIVNPSAGHGRCGPRAEAALERLRAAGLRIEVHLTAAPRHAIELAKAAVLAGHRRLLVMGGDGTAFEVLNGCLGAHPSERIRLAILPLGTGNSLVSDLGPRARRRIERALLADEARPCDVLHLVAAEGERFMLGHLGLGLVADIAELVNRRLKRWGPWSYLLGVLLSLRRLRPATVTLAVDGGAMERREATFVFVNNNRTVGGNMRMAPGASPFDGRADLVWADPVSVASLLRTLPKLFWGGHVTHPAIRLASVRRVAFAEPSPVLALLDGEVETLTPHEIEVLAGAVDLVC